MDDTVEAAAREMLREAKSKFSGTSKVAGGWKLTSHVVHPENESDLAKLWNVWLDYTKYEETIFWGNPDDGVFVVARKA